MKGIFGKLRGNSKEVIDNETMEEENLKRQVSALLSLLSDLYGAERVVLKAGKLEALALLRSEVVEERVLALQRLVFEDPTIDELPSREEIPAILEEIEEEIADLLARRAIEEKIEKKVTERMQKKHEEYIREIRMQIIKEDGGPENAQTLKKYAQLEMLESKKLSRSAMEVVRPKNLSEVVGQEAAIKALLSKIATPYPQHVILYGPPGVGKTTAARLALEEVKKLSYTPFAEDAPFVEVDGTTLRWDPREITNPLLGSVHDPIYQGARRDLADGGIPEPKPGLVTEAHGGILFIDEIGEMDPLLQTKLLKVLEDKRVTFDSSYYDASNPQIPQYIKKLFEDGAPADFILIGATTRDPSEINPAIRSRCAEVFFEPLTQNDIRKIVLQAAERLEVKLEDGVAEIISDYTIEGRKAINLLADAFGNALYKRRGDYEVRKLVITKEDIYDVIQTSRLSPYVFSKAVDGEEIGKIFGLGVAGFLGSVLEIEAVAFPTRDKGKGSIRFNETAGSMARDSVFNATAVVRRVTGEDLGNYDVHVNIVGGGRIDGPSAGLAITAAIISTIQKKPIRQDLAVTGEISIQGKVKPVGGIPEKIYGAKQAGMKKVIIPYDNQKDVPYGLKGIEVVAVKTIQEALTHIITEEVKQNIKVG
ncbi:MAG TPA: ATP-dependent protease, Lon family [Clostridia bacterium]|nr:ATP-dependent protease, Lon family [Clostridia bacterium]